jgi:glycerate kinase
MNVLLAFDKYKSALTATEAVAHARDAISAANPEAKIQEAPLTDGGEGFASIIAQALNGDCVTVAVEGPLRRKVEGRYALVDAQAIPSAALELLQLPTLTPAAQIAFVEMASASGYESLAEDERDPWKTTTYGTGQLLAHAASAGAEAIVLGIGGSATNDCGVGALEALGVLFYDHEFQPVTQLMPEKFKQVSSAGSTSHLIDTFPPVRIASDVDNPLLGPTGATRVFGPQKGLLPEDADRLERAVRQMANRILGLYGRAAETWESHLQEPGTGAAGGIGFALRHALPDSRFCQGFALISAVLDLPAKIVTADCLVTGEGSLDSSSLSGKGPVALLRTAPHDKTIHFLAGRIEAEAAESLQDSYPNLKVHRLSDPAWPLQKALAETAHRIREILHQVFSQTF